MKAHCHFETLTSPEPTQIVNVAPPKPSGRDPWDRSSREYDIIYLLGRIADRDFLLQREIRGAKGGELFLPGLDRLAKMIVGYLGFTSH